MAACPHCGSENAGELGYCQKCGQPLETAAAAVVEAPAAAGPPRTAPRAIAGLVFGLLSLFPLFALVAVLNGHVARSQIRKSQGTLKGGGLALAGLVLGYAGLGFFALVLLAMIPDLVGRRHSQPMAYAVGSLRTLNTAQVTYASEYPERGFSKALAQLGPPPPGAQPSPEAAGFIDEVLAAGTKNEYRFTYIPGPANEKGVRTSYALRAEPSDPSKGYRSFYTDDTGVIRWEVGRSAGPASPPLD